MVKSKDEHEKAVQDRMNQVEYALELLADGAHPHLENYINGLLTHYRVMNDAAILEDVHQRCPNSIELLQQNSRAVGTICPSFEKGQLQLTTYSTDLNQAELISRSTRAISDIILQALGVGRSEKELIDIPIKCNSGIK